MRKVIGFIAAVIIAVSPNTAPANPAPQAVTAPIETVRSAALAEFDAIYASLESETVYDIDSCGSHMRRTIVRRSNGRIARSVVTDSFRIRGLKAMGITRH